MRRFSFLFGFFLLLNSTSTVSQESEALWLKQGVPCSWGLAVSPDTSIYCIDAFGPGVIKFDSEGHQLTNWGTAGTGSGEFQGPRGAAVDSSGRLYVADESNNRIQRFAADGSFEKMWGNDVLTGSGSEGTFETCSNGDNCYTGIPSSQGFTFPHDIGIDPIDDSLIIADTVAARVVRIDPVTDEITVLFNSCEQEGCGQVLGAVMDAGEVLYVTIDFNNVARYDFDPVEGEYTRTWLRNLGDGAPPTAHYVAVDPLGNVYVSDSQNHRIQKFSPDGDFIMLWGWGVATGANKFEVCTEEPGCLPGIPWGNVDPDNPGQMTGPNGIATDTKNNMYVVDDTGRLQKFGKHVSVTNELVKLLASDGDNDDFFGRAVALDGRIALVGAALDDDLGSGSGAAYVYLAEGPNWTEQVKLLASDGMAGQQFGSAVALDGDTAVVAAPHDSESGIGAGAVYVFAREGSNWVEQAKLMAADAAAEDRFGTSVALDGDTLAVGATWDDDNGDISGSAYVFIRDGASWAQQVKLTASDGAAGDNFGVSVAINDDTILVGADEDDDAGDWSGSAYVYVRAGDAWTEQAKLTASDGTTDEYFGGWVAVSGDTALIGAWGDSDNGDYSGSAYVFTREGSAWSEQTKLMPSDGDADDWAGWPVALEGDIALIGASGDEDNGSGSGSAYVFKREGGSWTEVTKLQASDAEENDSLGEGLDISGNMAALGARKDDDNGTWSGSAYLFSLIKPEVVFASDSGLNRFCRGAGTGSFDCSSVSVDNRLSWDAATGDINNDGQEDVVFANASVANQACLRTGRTTFSCSDINADDNESRAVSLSDFNNDGNLDAVFANYGQQNNRVCFGDGNGAFNCSNVSTETGWSLSVAVGDLNGDGNSDAVFANDNDPNSICLGDGSGGFACSDVSEGNLPTMDVALGDMDGDLRLDIVFANVHTPNQLCSKDSLGDFECNDISGDSLPTTAVALGEVNGDGRLDAMFGNDGQANRVCIGVMGDTFSCTDVSSHTLSTWELALGDTNGDGVLDAVFANAGVQADQACIGHGDGQFTCSDIGTDTTSSVGVTLSPEPDFDGDGIHDALDDCSISSYEDQRDVDGDGIPDACDECPYDFLNTCNNTAPIAEDSTVETDEDTPLLITLAASDADGDPLDYTILTGPVNGTLGGLPPSVTFTPDTEWSGGDSFTFLVSDGIVDSNVATVFITVNVVNDPPVAFEQSVETEQDAEVEIVLLASDVDNEDDLLEYFVDTQPLHGTLDVRSCEFGGPYTNDDHTLLLAHFNGSYDGEQGETASASGTEFVAGRHGDGVYIGSGDSLTFPAADNLLAEQGAIEFWAKPSWSVPDGSHRMFLNALGGMVLVKDHADNFRFMLEADDSEAYKHHHLSGWGADEWHHIAVTWSIPGEMKSYFDGVLRIQHSASEQDLMTPFPDVISIGQEYMDPFEGVIDELRISDIPRFGDIPTCAGRVLVYTPDPGFYGEDSLTFHASDGMADSNIATVTITVTEATDFDLLSTDPAQNSPGVPNGATLSANFSSPVDANFVTQETFVVRGAQTGLLNGTWSAVANDARFLPDFVFHPGEQITATLTTGLQGTNTTSLAAPFSWRFNAAVLGGSGMFLNGGTYTAGNAGTEIALGDLDGDGDLDAFIAQSANKGSLVLLNDGYGVFADTGQALGPAQSYSVALGDVDDDGDLDAFIANDATPNTVWLNDGTGTFFNSGQALGAGRSAAVELADLDGDGDLDAFVANRVDEPNRVWMNNGFGLFTDSGQVIGAARSHYVALGDVEGDGDLDAYVANAAGQPDKVWLNNGVGIFSDSGQSIGTDDSRSVALGDLDGDGNLDAYVTAFFNDPDKVWFNDGTGLFTDSGQALGAASAGDVALGDLDGDGDLDAFTASGCCLSEGIWINDGAGTFSAGMPIENSNASGIALGDLDGDGDLDAFAAVTGEQRVWLNNVAPQVSDLNLITDENVSLEVSLVGVDADDDSLEFFVITAPSFGSLSGTGATLVYTPVSNWSGSDSFTYKANDGTSDSNIATAFITVVETNDPPLVNAGSDIVVSEGEPFELSGSFTDSDDGDTHTIIWDFGDGFSHSGELLSIWWMYQQDGIYTVSMTVTDSEGASGSDSLIVTALNVPPTAESQSVVTDEDTPVTITLTGYDPGTDPLTFEVLGNPAHGVLTGTPPELTYSPEPNYYGDDAFQFRLLDDDGPGNTADIIITINPVNDPPALTLSPLVQSGNEGESFAFSGTFSDVDPEDSHAVLWDFGDGNALEGTLAPNHVYADDGEYTARLTVTDSGGLAESLTATVTVADVPPVALATVSDDSPPYGVTVVFDGSASYAAATDRLSFHWDYGGDLPWVGAWVQQVFANPGAQTVTLTVSDDDGNSDSATLNLSVEQPGPSQIVTVAGGGAAGDHTLATLASLNGPWDTSTDDAGNLYIADSSNHRVRKVDATTGVITTVAGTGARGYSGDGGSAMVAQLHYPYGLSTDGTGNLYIADSGNHRVRRVDLTTGVITTVAGTGISGYGGDSGPATAARLFSPKGLSVDSAGNLYIADRRNCRIRRVDAASGVITTVAGIGIFGFGNDGGPATAALLKYPTDVSVDGADNLYIADPDNHRIRRVDAASGVITTVAGTGVRGFSGDDGSAVAAKLNYPQGVSVDSAGNLYIADRRNYRIRRVDMISGVITTVVGNGVRAYGGDDGPATTAQMSDPTGVNVDRDGNLYIADWVDHRIRQVDASSDVISTVAGNGVRAYGGEGGPATAAQLFYPQDIGLDSVGNLYIADRDNERIRRVDAVSGVITTVAGTGTYGYSGDGGLATVAQLRHPYGVSLDSAGNLYIADPHNQRIRRVDAVSGVITTVAGTGVAGYSGDGGAATVAQLRYPFGVSVDSAGNLYIADRDNQRIRRVDAVSGVITTVAGTGVAGFSGDGGAATVAQLRYPYGVSLDSDGNLYIADRGNQRIRRVDAVSGMINTVAGTGTYGYSGDGGLATAARLNGPSGLSVDSIGDLYIADTGNHRIRKIEATTGIITTAAGTGVRGFKGDGGKAQGAELNYPYEVSVDGNSNLYIADWDNHRIRKVMAGPPGVQAHLQVTPEVILEGEGLVLDANGSSTPNASAGGFIETFEFDLDQDGEYDLTSTSSGEITLDWSELASFDFTPGRQLVAVKVSDSTGDSGLAFAEWTLTTVSSETPPSVASEPVTVAPSDLVTGETIAEISFEAVATGGLTTVETVPVGDEAILPEQGSGFVLGADTYLEISTTAEFEGLVAICLNYGEEVDEAHLELAHLVETDKLRADGLVCEQPGGCWEIVTSEGYPDTENNVICGEVASLSPFALVTQVTASATEDPVPTGDMITASATIAESVIVSSGLWTWGDGSSSDAEFDYDSRTLSGTHLYQSPGVYVVTLDMIEAGQVIGRVETNYVVVYDPTAGFVTGGGWINSPQGAYTADPELTGKATFGFVSKYKKGTTVPTGETEFRFKAAGLGFHSSEYQWLVVAGAKAQFKGVGTINGVGNFGFMLTALDAALTPSVETDRFRIKIWDRDDADTVVYDNQLDAEDGSEPTTEIGGGSIVVHKVKTK